FVFIDELDAAGRRRGRGGGEGGSDEREQTLNQMLVEMDGFSVSQGIVVIGATNRPDILDPALLRPGRFDRHVTVEQPDSEGRKEILELHAKGKPIASSVDFEYLARRTPGFSGADLANVINEAALLTVRAGKPEIHIEELEEAIQRVLSGPKRRGRVLSEEERHRAAYHESGHAILAAAAGHATDVHRITILARGRGLGMTTVQTEQALLLTRTQLFSQIVIAMGGLSAENIVFGEPSTGAEQDLEQATDMARDMVGRFGMGTRRRRLLTKDADAFLGNELGVSDLSNLTHEEMEKEIDDLLTAAEKKAVDLLTKNKVFLDKLAIRLESDETIEGVELEKELTTVALEPSLIAISSNGSDPIGSSEKSGSQASSSRPHTA
ncbi:MAG: cell division protease FtsH, partial [Actinomycetota bacterium]|nr:cell division protease FtsH [Actinomycetota bacterium]